MPSSVPSSVRVGGAEVEQDEEPEPQGHQSADDEQQAALLGAERPRHAGQSTDEECHARPEGEGDGPDHGVAQDEQPDHGQDRATQDGRPEAAGLDPEDRCHEKDDTGDQGGPPDDEHGDRCGEHRVAQQEEACQDEDDAEDDVPGRPLRRSCRGRRHGAPSVVRDTSIGRYIRPEVTRCG